MARRAFYVFLLLLASLALRASGEEPLDNEIATVERLRGVSFAKAVEHKTIQRAELRKYIESQMQKELPGGTDGYLRMLVALHLVEPGTGIEPLLDLYDAQVLAFYDPTSHVYYSLDAPPGDLQLPEPMLEAVKIHELTHALQDQRWDAGKVSEGLQDDWDAAMAYQSLLEGEAVLVMMAYLGDSAGMPLESLIAEPTFLASIRDAAGMSMGMPDNVPRYFVESLQYPYIEGLAFVVDAYKRGGWKAVDAVYENPPQSTEELEHPEIYRARVSETRTRRVVKPPEDGTVETTLGEFHWSFLLGKEAGEGWGSDLVRVKSSVSGSTVLVDSTWDTPTDAKEFVAALHPFLEKKKDANIRIVLPTPTRVLAAWGSDQAAIKAFLRREAKPAK